MYTYSTRLIFYKINSFHSFSTLLTGDKDKSINFQSTETIYSRKKEKDKTNSWQNSKRTKILLYFILLIFPFHVLDSNMRPQRTDHISIRIKRITYLPTKN